MGVSVTGADEVIAMLEKLGGIETLYNAMDKAVLVVEKEARDTAPSGSTGLLRSSIESHVEASGDEVKGIVSNPIGYAPYVEYGTGIYATKGSNAKKIPWSYKDASGEWHTTSGQKPQPFLENAMDTKTDEVISIIQEALLSD